VRRKVIVASVELPAAYPTSVSIGVEPPENGPLVRRVTSLSKPGLSFLTRFSARAIKSYSKGTQSVFHRFLASLTETVRKKLVFKFNNFFAGHCRRRRFRHWNLAGRSCHCGALPSHTERIEKPEGQDLLIGGRSAKHVLTNVTRSRTVYVKSAWRIISRFWCPLQDF